MDIRQLSRKTDEVIGAQLSRVQQTAIMMAVAGLVLSGLGLATNPSAFFQSYLFAYMFWIGVTLGSLGLLMLHHAVGGGWGFLIRRFLEAATRLFLPMLVLFVPIILGMKTLYPWMRPEEVSQSPILQDKQAYLNPTFFYVRLVIYFAIWGIYAHLLNKWGAIQDERADSSVFNRLNVVGASGILVFVLSVTFMGVDWVMSLTPEWFSSIFGLLLVAMQSLSTLALMVVLLAFLGRGQPLLGELPKKYFRDLGNLTLALVMLWGYMSFSQYLIQYSGNLAEEVGWYVSRRQGGWGWVSLFLIPMHFGLPFFILLVGSNIKRDPQRLAKVMFFIILMRFVDLFWWVAPTFRDHFQVTFSDVGTPLLIGGIWLWLWAGQMRGRSLAPVHDPRLEAHLQEVASHG